MASAGVAASQASRSNGQPGALSFDHAQRAGCWTSGAPVRAVERSSRPSWNRLTGACEKLTKPVRAADHRLASQNPRREAPLLACSRRSS